MPLLLAGESERRRLSAANGFPLSDSPGFLLRHVAMTEAVDAVAPGEQAVVRDIGHS